MITTPTTGLDAIAARIRERPQEPLHEPVQRWHDETHPWPWSVCPERPCVEVRRHDRYAQQDLHADLDNVLTRHSAGKITDEEALTELGDLVDWWG